jgi:cytochrome c-type biogenesis protein CcmH
VVLHLIFAAMLVAAMLAILLPLARGARLKARAGASTLDLHRLRLAEIARDREHGLLDEASAEAARNEAARILLRAAERDEAMVQAQGQEGDGGRLARKRRRAVALVALIGLPALVLPVYALLGSPSLPARPFLTNTSDDPASLDLATLIGQVEAHLAAHPDDGKGYEAVAPAYLRLGRYEDALRARSEAVRLLGETPDRLANLAEARIAASGGVVTSEAAEAIAKALGLDPKHPKARFLEAIAFEQDGRIEDAVATLKAMLADAPADAPWRAAVEARLARLSSPADGQAAIVAGLPQGAQGVAIRSMVEGLAARLKQQGGSAEEWARLVRSYAVLGEKDKALATLAEARIALPDEASRATLLLVARASGLEAAP